MQSPDQDLGPILGRFPASELHSTFLFIHALTAFREMAGQNELKLLNEISLERLAARDLRLTQVREAISVLRSVHNALYGKPDGSVGIGIPITKPPTLSEDGHVSGLAWLPLQRLDEELSKKEHEFPQNKKINIRISRVGDVSIYEDSSRIYSLTTKELEYVRFIFSRTGSSKRMGLKQVATGVHATSQNASRDIATINKNVGEKLGLKYLFIDRKPAVGYFLNNEQYNILMG